MAYGSSRCVRVRDDPELDMSPQTNEDDMNKVEYEFDGRQIKEPSFKRFAKEARRSGRSLKAKVLCRVFSEDYERVKEKILDPRGPTIRRWNKIFLGACLLSLFVDPLFMYLPVVRNEVCITTALTLQVVLTIARSILDLFYIAQIFIRFRTAYVAPSSRVFGRGELVIDSSKIALRYLSKGFWVDVIVALPLPQVLIWLIIPNLGYSLTKNIKNVVLFILTFQYIPKLLLVFPLSSQTIGVNAVETAWSGTAYNLMLYMLASNVAGAVWYLLSIEREEACWKHVCNTEMPLCQYSYFNCQTVNDQDRNNWFQVTNSTTICDSSTNNYPYGIYANLVTSIGTSTTFFTTYFYCLGWGLRNVSSSGQNLTTTTYIGENSFALLIGAVGLVLFALLLGNMQRYLLSATVRVEEWRVKRTDTEQWMHHRQLPPDLRQSIRKYDQYKWVATRGVDEEALLQDLPMDLQRDIKRHLCLDLVRRVCPKVPLFDQMDDRMLDAICERLKPALCTQGTFVVREGDPVNAMLFVIRGNLVSYTTNGGRTGFFNSCRIGPGDFCGEELLTWALEPRPSFILPSSTRTVKAVCEVEAFALVAEDLKFVAAQFRRMHSKQLRHKFKFYSHQWRTWAACFIQTAYRRYKRRKIAAELKVRENPMADECGTSMGQSDVDVPPPGSGLSVYAAKFTASLRRGANKHSGSDPGVVSLLQKPAEPDFYGIEE